MEISLLIFNEKRQSLNGLASPVRRKPRFPLDHARFELCHAKTGLENVSTITLFSFILELGFPFYLQ